MDNSSYNIITPEDISRFEELGRQVMTAEHTDMFPACECSFPNVMKS